MKSVRSTLFNKTYHGATKNCVRRGLIASSRDYSDEGKSIYQREEEGKKPRTIYGKEYPEWRRPWIQRPGEFKTKLGIFNEKNPSPEILNVMQKLPNLTIENIKEWWNDMKTTQEIVNQRYLPERVASLGKNLAALHFFTYRNAAVRLKDSKEWICGNLPQLEALPNHYVEGYHIEAIDCSNFHHNGIRYEGLQNLTGLNFLKWLSLKDQKYIDVWCLSRIAGQNGSTLEYLDISSCNLDLGCVFALAKMTALRVLIIKDPKDNVVVQAALSFLESENTKLVIKVAAEPEKSTEKV